jgi:hypothetical protein
MTDISLPTNLVGTDFRVGRDADRATSDFRVGRVLERTGSVLARNFMMFIPVAAIPEVPKQLVSYLVTGAANGTPHASISLELAGLGVLSFCLMMLSQIIVLRGAFADLRGRPVSLGECLQAGGRRFFPFLWLSICTGFCLGFAALLLFVPALILFTMWYVAMPASAIEEIGAIESMQRSSQLTRGHRWQIFGLIVCVFLIAAMAGGMVGVSLNAIGGQALKLVGDVLLGGVGSAIGTVASAVAYYELRVAKEGIDTERVAAVFE